MGLLIRCAYDLRMLVVAAGVALWLAEMPALIANAQVVPPVTHPSRVLAGSSSGSATVPAVGGPPKPAVPLAPSLQLVYPPSDIVVNGRPDSAQTTLTLRLSDANTTISGVQIVGGLLKGRGSDILPAQAFEICIVSPGSGSPKSSQATAIIRWKDGERQAGTYSGTFLIGTNDVSAAVPVTMNVSYRPRCAWWIGTIAIAIGAGISWFCVVWVVRMRTKAENEVLVARLAETLQNLRAMVEKNVLVTGVACPETLDHIDRLLREGLRRLLTDAELSAQAGITVPASGVTVLDEIAGLSGVIQIGFQELMTDWNITAPANWAPLLPLFEKMDGLGGRSATMSDLTAEVQAILAAVPQATASPEMAMTENVSPRQRVLRLPSERAVVHRVAASTYVLDILSLLTVVVVGMYSLIWSNPGFGSAGDYILAFLWGIGLKLGSDVAKLNPSDVRTAFATKIPTAVP